jgi:hypothetical protein
VRLQRVIQDRVRSTTQRRGSAVKPIWPASLRTISMVILKLVAA